ncbi:hypothetical protein [Labedella endophytica]|uniref:Uncharacterized protein n=1 Tax=Labedella endophytica TaxID=1523160 RepID=A0A3S0X193_9MICO|nr:hypothetical protein [Labedella endophytica]RUR03555.1 hypothetical protein ELQ94_03225 [Labedella endophytica]
MAQSNAHKRQILDLDAAISSDEYSSFSAITRTADGSVLRGWYARLLTALALATGGEPVVFARGRNEEEHGTANIVVFTESVLAVADVDDTTSDDGAPTVRFIPRSAIRSLRFTASDRSDDERAERYTWPGTLSIELAYDGLDELIALSGSATEQFAVNQPASIWRLLEGLQADLLTGSSKEGRMG